MSDTEQLIRAALSEQAERSPRPSDALSHHVRAAGRRQRISLAALSTALVVAAAGTIAGIALTRPSPAAGRPSDPGPALASSASPQPDRGSSGRVIGVHGIDLTVPSNWKLNDTDCGSPAANTVLTEPPASEICMTTMRTHNLVDATGRAEDVPSGGHVVTHHISQSGLTLVTTRTVAKPGDMLVVIPADDFHLNIDVSSGRVADDIVASIRAASTSPEGCAMQTPQNALRPLGFTRAASSHVLPMSNALEGMAVCHYVRGWLATSAMLRHSSAMRLAHALDTGDGFAFNPALRCGIPPNDHGSVYLLQPHLGASISTTPARIFGGGNCDELVVAGPHKSATPLTEHDRNLLFRDLNVPIE